MSNPRPVKILPASHCEDNLCETLKPDRKTLASSFPSSVTLDKSFNPSGLNFSALMTGMINPSWDSSVKITIISQSCNICVTVGKLLNFYAS